MPEPYYLLPESLQEFIIKTIGRAYFQSNRLNEDFQFIKRGLQNLNKAPKSGDGQLVTNKQ
jgi:hypothetical protein